MTTAVIFSVKLSTLLIGCGRNRFSLNIGYLNGGAIDLGDANDVKGLLLRL